MTPPRGSGMVGGTKIPLPSAEDVVEEIIEAYHNAQSMIQIVEENNRAVLEAAAGVGTGSRPG